MLEEIRSRRAATVEHALLMLDLAPQSDTDSRYVILKGVGRYLHDPRIVAKWIALAAAEQDTQLKARMIRKLAGLDPRGLPARAEWLAFLKSSLAQDEIRDTVLWLMGRLSVQDPETRKVLTEFYREQAARPTGKLILSWLLVPSDAPEDLVDFFAGILDEVDADDKQAIVLRLLRRDRLEAAQLSRLLDPAEPAGIKRMVLHYALDRAYLSEPALQALIRRDTTPDIRMAALRALATLGVSQPGTLDTVLHALREDPDKGVRHVAAEIFQYAISLGPEIIGYCCTLLREEKNTDNALQLLGLLTPYLDREGGIVESLMEISASPVRSSLALAIYSALGKLLPGHVELFTAFVQRYDKEERDDCKAAILRAITNAPAQGEGMGPFYTRALRAPAAAIRNWGMEGALQLPLIPENGPVMEAAAPLLRERGLDAGKQRRLAAKIACIPEKSPGLVADLQQAIDHSSDTQLQEICRKALERVASIQDGEGIDWDQWLRQADVEHELGTIFPNIWIYYDDDPATARKILWSALNPANSDSLYRAGVSEGTILSFLAARNEVDELLVSFCVNRLLNATGHLSPDLYLLILRNRPDFAEPGKTCWLILEKHGSAANLLLLHELLMKVFGEGLKEAFEKEAGGKDTAAACRPYLRYLAENAVWPPAIALLKMMAGLPLVRDDKDNRSLLKEACGRAGLDGEEVLLSSLPPGSRLKKDSPGFADE